MPKHHDWGSHHRIPEFVGENPSDKPVAELWYGAHPLGPATLSDGTLLSERIAEDPDSFLGPSTQYSFGNELPYLVKLIAPASPLSIQVHPGRQRAAAGFAEEQDSGLPLGHPRRSFQDPTHKPEMIFALSDYDALVGFAVRRQARLRLEGLESKIAGKLSRRLLMAAGRGIKPVVAWILDPDDGPGPEDIVTFVEDCKRRSAAGASPDPFIDQAVADLYDRFGPDPAIMIAFLMNHVRLSPGEAVFVPTGTVHSYQDGFGLEVMANSDNVVRAGLTNKHVAADLFLEIADFDGGPPLRIAPEHPTPGVSLFRSPIEDFELLAAHVEDSDQAPVALPMAGPRIAVCLGGRVRLATRAKTLDLVRGQAAFIRDSDGRAVASGHGDIALCSVP